MKKSGQADMADEEIKTALAASFARLLNRQYEKESTVQGVNAEIKMYEDWITRLKKKRKAFLNRQKSKKGYNPKAHSQDFIEKIIVARDSVINHPDFVPARKNSIHSDAYRVIARFILEKEHPFLKGAALQEAIKRRGESLKKAVYRHYERNSFGNIFIEYFQEHSGEKRI